MRVRRGDLALGRRALRTRCRVRQLHGDFKLSGRRFGVKVGDGTRLRMSRSRCGCGLGGATLRVRDLGRSSSMALVHGRLLGGSLRHRDGGLGHTRRQLRSLVVGTPVNNRLDFIGMAPNRRITSKRDVTRVGILSRCGVRASLDRCCVSHVAANLPTAMGCRKGHCPLEVAGMIPRMGSHVFSMSLMFAKRVPRGIHMKGDFQMRVRLNRPRRTVIVPHKGFCRSAKKR